MNLESVENKLGSESLSFKKKTIIDQPAVIIYDKKFKWSWVATQLNTFIVIIDLGDQKITIDVIEKYLTETFSYARKNYTGWPKGLQSALCGVAVLISSNVDEEAKDYCQKLKTGKKWAGVSVPVIYDNSKNETYIFEKNPIWGRVYYPYIKNLIRKTGV